MGNHVGLCSRARRFIQQVRSAPRGTSDATKINDVIESEGMERRTRFCKARSEPRRPRGFWLAERGFSLDNSRQEPSSEAAAEVCRRFFPREFRCNSSWSSLLALAGGGTLRATHALLLKCLQGAGQTRASQVPSRLSLREPDGAPRCFSAAHCLTTAHGDLSRRRYPG